MENTERNLSVLIRQFRGKGSALKGYRIIKPLILENNDISLSILLRNHNENPIDSVEEVIDRGNIDSLIDYFNILEVGLIAGYLPNPLPRKVEQEIKLILSNKFVYRYISEYYPVYLPQLLLHQILNRSSEKYFELEYSNENSTILFERFLMLNQIVKKDSDILQFLWFLDDGWTEDYSIKDIVNLLIDSNTIKNKLKKRTKNPLDNALWGFIKYIQFLSDFVILLHECDDNYVLQSAFWYNQSYWLEHMKEKLGTRIILFIDVIRQSVGNIDNQEIDYDKNSFKRSYHDLQKDSNQLEEIKNLIDFLLQRDFSEPFKEIFFKYSDSIFDKRKPDIEESGMKELAY